MQLLAEHRQEVDSFGSAASDDTRRIVTFQVYVLMYEQLLTEADNSSYYN